MSRTSDFSKIKGVARIGWEMRTETPLCIKAGTTSAWNQSTSLDRNTTKLRQVDATFNFFQKENISDDASISDFFYDAFIKENALRIRYRIPASSLRGALRNYTIRRLVPKNWQDAELAPTRKDNETEEAWDKRHEKHYDRLKKALDTPGWHLIQNLFGMATETEIENLADETVAGRLRVMVNDLPCLNEKDFQAGLLNGENFSIFRPGSTYGRMVFTTRNPLDRITQAAKDGGLHSFTELAPGNRFSATLEIVNPVPADLGFAAFWEQSMNNGLLRIGGLTSVGRGRVRIESSDIRLFLRSANGFSGLSDAPSRDRADVLDGLFSEYSIPGWENEKQIYLKKLNDFYNTLQTSDFTHQQGDENA